MTHEEGESLIDRVRHAFGRQTDDADDSKVVNRPAGPDYAAEEPIDTDINAGLTRADTTHDFDGVEVTTDDRPLDVTTDERLVERESFDEGVRREPTIDDPL